jgi:hypothetical protein
MKHIIYIACILTMLAACSKILNKVPESNFTPDNFYKNADDAKAAISAVYDQLNTDNLYNQAMWIIQDQSTDDCEWGTISTNIPLRQPPLPSWLCGAPATAPSTGPMLPWNVFHPLLWMKH